MWKAVQMRWTVDFDTPVASAMERQLRCVLPPGGSPLSVFRGSAVISSSPMEHGLPGLRSSYRPVSPCASRSARATCRPSGGPARTLSARLTSPAGRLREPASDSSSSRVPRLTSSGFNGRPRGGGLLLGSRVDEEVRCPVLVIMATYLRDAILGVRLQKEAA